MEPVYLIAPTAVVGALAAYGVAYTRHVKRFAGSIEVVLTEKWGGAFRLAPNELLCAFWMGQIYDGPAIPEYHDEHGDKPGRLTEQAAPPAGTKGRPRKPQIYLALTTHDRLVVGRTVQRGAGERAVAPHSEWVPGSKILFARELKPAPGQPPTMENGYRGRPYFVMFGATPGARLPAWIPADAAAAIAAWRVPRPTRRWWRRV